MDVKRGDFFDLSIIKNEIWFNDFEICFSDDGYKEKGNRVMFASKSEYFRQNLRDCDLVVIVNEGGFIKHKNEVMKAVKEFFMFGRVGNLKEHVLESLLRFSVLIEQYDLITLCVYHITRFLKDNNFVYYRRLGVNLNLKSLTDATKFFLARNFQKIPDIFLYGMDYEFLEDILLTEALNTKDERNLFYLLKKWILHDKYERCVHFKHFYFLLPLGGFSNKFMIDEVLPFCYKMESLCTNRTMLQLQENIYQKTLLIIGNECPDKANCVEVYNSEEKKWIMLGKLNNNVESFASVIYEGNLLIIGGEINDLFFKNVRLYDLKNNKAFVLPSINVNRSCFTATVIKDSVYICGGCNNDYTTNTLEVWNPKLSTWKMLSSMKIRRRLHSAVACNGKLYVFGGIYENDEALDSVEIYDPLADTWSFGTPMTMAVHSCASAVLDDFIYIMGGSTDNRNLKSVYKYSTLNNLWFYSVDLPRVMSGVSAVTINNKIIITGGNNSKRIYEFDSLTQVWEKHSSLAVNRFNHTLLTIPHSLLEPQTL